VHVSEVDRNEVVFEAALGRWQGREARRSRDAGRSGSGSESSLDRCGLRQSERLDLQAVDQGANRNFVPMMELRLVHESSVHAEAISAPEVPDHESVIDLGHAAMPA
jgi:hypothetical protein